MVAERARLAELVQRLPANQRETALASQPVRSTLLDPQRPARDLLEHLLDGINSCWLLYDEYANDAAIDLDQDDESEDYETEDLAADVEDDDEVVETGNIDVDPYDPVADAHRPGAIAQEFAELVREPAAASRGRLI